MIGKLCYSWGEGKMQMSFQLVKGSVFNFSTCGKTILSFLLSADIAAPLIYTRRQFLLFPREFDISFCF